MSLLETPEQGTAVLSPELRRGDDFDPLPDVIQPLVYKLNLFDPCFLAYFHNFHNWKDKLGKKASKKEKKAHIRESR